MVSLLLYQSYVHVCVNYDRSSVLIGGNQDKAIIWYIWRFTIHHNIPKGKVSSLPSMIIIYVVTSVSVLHNICLKYSGFWEPI